jgi:putative membrane protein
MKKTNTGIANTLRSEEKKVKIFLIIFFMVGVTGFALPITSNFFTHLTPVALLLSFGVLIIFHRPVFTVKTALIFLLIFALSFLIEAAGVRSGLIFGSYSYGRGLGIKLIDTPLMIGINWLLLVYCTSIIASQFPISSIMKILSASVLMVIYDLVLEQIAPQIEMWEFDGRTAPVRNYVFWLLIAVFFQLILKLSGIKSENRLAAFVFFLQFAFFLALLIIFKLFK